jgi:hypothetical protein
MLGFALLGQAPRLHLVFLLPPCWGALRVLRIEGGDIKYPPSLPLQGGQKPNMRSETTHP